MRLSQLSFYITQGYLPGVPPPTVSWAPSYPSLTKEIYPDLPTGQSDGGFFSVEVPSPQMTLACQADKTLMNTPQL